MFGNLKFNGYGKKFQTLWKFKNATDSFCPQKSHKADISGSPYLLNFWFPNMLRCTYRYKLPMSIGGRHCCQTSMTVSINS